MKRAAEAQEYEQAALERNRLRAVRSLLERQRVANDVGRLARRDRRRGRRHRRQRPGLPGPRRRARRSPVVLPRERRRAASSARSRSSSSLQYYADRPGVPPQIIVQREVDEDERATIAAALSERRGAGVEVRAAERGDKRRILELAERNAALALDQERLKDERRRQQRVEALDELQSALGLDVLPLRIECFDISNLMGTHTVASMVVFEGGAPKKSDYRRFNDPLARGGRARRLRGDARGADAAPGAWESQRELSPHDPAYNESFAALPNVIVIDGGKGQLGAGLEVLQDFRERGVAVVSLAKRIEEVFVPGRQDPIVLAHDTNALQLLQRVRDEAHRFAITHHRTRRDKAMTASVLDGFPGVGPARKKALLAHFGSPDAVLAASREDLEGVPGLPPKVARDLHAFLRRPRA